MSTSTKRDDRRIDAIVRAAEGYGIVSSPAWAPLRALSDETRLDQVRVSSDGIILDGDRFTGLMDVFVLRQYRAPAAFAEGDSFPAEFSGHFEDDKPVIDAVEVDTSFFLAGETDA